MKCVAGIIDYTHFIVIFLFCFLIWIFSQLWLGRSVFVGGCFYEQCEVLFYTPVSSSWNKLLIDFCFVSEQKIKVKWFIRETSSSGKYSGEKTSHVTVEVSAQTRTSSFHTLIMFLVSHSD